jgi:osmotically-inducible protein OsmY
MSNLSMDLTPQMDSSDDLLAERIRERIANRHRYADRRVTVEVNSKVATLRGHAASYYQRQQWLHDAKSVKEVEDIVDLIEVI